MLKKRVQKLDLIYCIYNKKSSVSVKVPWAVDQPPIPRSLVLTVFRFSPLELVPPIKMTLLSSRRQAQAWEKPPAPPWPGITVMSTDPLNISAVLVIAPTSSVCPPKRIEYANKVLTSYTLIYHDDCPCLALI